MTFEEFAANRLAGVLRFAAVLTGDRALAEDLAQEVLIRAHSRWRKIGNLDRPECYVRKMILNEEVHVRVGPATGSDGKVYKDGEYSFTMPSGTALHDYINNYTANLDQGGLQLSGTSMWVDHFSHAWSECHATFVLGFTLDAAGIRAEIANGQFTVIGRTELYGQQAIELKISVPPSDEAPPHTTAERMWVNATTYLPMREYTHWSNGRKSVFDYVFLPPTPENLAKLRPVIPAGYTRAACAQGTGPKPRTRGFPPPS